MPDYAALARELSSALPELEIRENEPMSEHCSFRIGGPARLMLLPGSAAQAAAALGMLRRAGAQTLIMGNGTNLLIPDGGYAGAVVCMSRPMSELAALDGGRIRAGAGATLASAAVFAAERGLSGLEFAHGIPGSVGGGVAMNALTAASSKTCSRAWSLSARMGPYAPCLPGSCSSPTGTAPFPTPPGS